MGYIGGKSAHSRQGTGKWIASLLPAPASRQLYAETFCGMLGILLQRTPAGVEIANDANHLVVNWWRVIRERQEEFSRMVLQTPHSRVEYDAACERLSNNEGDSLRQAVDYTIAIGQGRIPRVGGGWRLVYNRYGPVGWSGPLLSSVPALAQRLYGVQLECQRGEHLTAKLSGLKHALLYVDPPYPTKSDGLYDIGFDREALYESLRVARVRVAISGYDDEWDHLGWRRNEHKSFRVRPDVPMEKRTEVLWTNFKPAGQGMLDLAT